MKLIKKLHLWLAVPFGIIITLTCFSGAMLVFEPEITAALHPDIYYIKSSAGTPMSVEEVEEAAWLQLPDDVDVREVKTFDDPTRTYQVLTDEGRHTSVFFDQYAGKITGRYEREAFFMTMFKMHRWLMGSGRGEDGEILWGKLTVGISTAMFAITLITGLCLWVPRARRGLGSSLRLRTDKGRRGFWKSFHVAGGVYMFLPLMAMALTGLTWSFGWYRTVFYALCGAEAGGHGHGHGADPLRGLIYAIHTGAFGGTTTRILWFTVALLGASLPVTGYYLWIKRRIKH